MPWLDQILLENAKFKERINPENLPIKPSTETRAIVTCMDHRINLEALGIPGFGPDGSRDSSIRVIRTAGSMAESRSLVLVMYLSGVREIVFIGHNDCGCHQNETSIEPLIENMKNALPPHQFEVFKASIGEPFKENLLTWLKAFEDPRAGLRQEIESLRTLPFIPPDLITHGLLYDVETGNLEVVVNGYER
jgi:carbonic anhydrase